MIAGGVRAGSDGAEVASLEAFLREALSRRGAAGRWLMISLPAPRVALTRLFTAPISRMNAFLFEPPTGPKVAGFGVVSQCRESGWGDGASREDKGTSGRTARLKRDAAAALDAIEGVRHPEALAITPKYFGGLAFDRAPSSHRSRHDSADPWAAFGRGIFTLPRWTYTQDADRATLSVTVGADESVSPEATVAELRSILSVLTASKASKGRGRSTATPVAPAPIAAIDETSLDEFLRLVRDIKEDIGRGVLGKVVAARRSVLTFDHVLDPWFVMDSLQKMHPGALKFGFSFGEATFLGASPELLVSRSGLEVRSEAVAGTVSTTEPHAGDRLSESRKDREEHQFVVDHLCDRLGTLCGFVRPPAPEVRHLGEIAHLVTRLTGQLETPVHILDLVDVLHPTPAVCGTPAELAAQFIRTHEEDDRGWYAGPVGWFDGHGQGEFWMALRSGVLLGKSAFLFAGAGVVARSDPMSEYSETSLKLRTLLRALKVES